MLIIAIILFRPRPGALPQTLLGSGRAGVAWTGGFAAGSGGSFVGGLLISLLAGDGLELRPSGIIGSIVGALIVTFAWQWWRGRERTSH